MSRPKTALSWLTIVALSLCCASMAWAQNPTKAKQAVQTLNARFSAQQTWSLSSCRLYINHKADVHLRSHIDMDKVPAANITALTENGKRVVRVSCGRSGGNCATTRFHSQSTPKRSFTTSPVATATLALQMVGLLRDVVTNCRASTNKVKIGRPVAIPRTRANKDLVVKGKVRNTKMTSQQALAQLKKDFNRINGQAHRWSLDKCRTLQVTTSAKFKRTTSSIELAKAKGFASAARGKSGKRDVRVNCRARTCGKVTTLFMAKSKRQRKSDTIRTGRTIGSQLTAVRAAKLRNLLNTIHDRCSSSSVSTSKTPARKRSPRPTFKAPRR